jgi:hypothetical protein
MELTEDNLKALQSTIQFIRTRVEKLEYAELANLAERRKSRAIIEQLKEDNKKLVDYCSKLEDQIEQNHINEIEASEYA